MLGCQRDLEIHLGNLADSGQVHGVRAEEVVVSDKGRSEAEAGESTGMAAGAGNSAG